MKSGEYAHRTGLTRNAVGDTWEGSAYSHAGSGSADATITLTSGTNRAVVGFTIATSSWTAADTFRVYRGPVATGTALTGALPLHAVNVLHEISFTEPAVFDNSVVTVRIVSTAAATISILVHYDYD